MSQPPLDPPARKRVDDHVKRVVETLFPPLDPPARKRLEEDREDRFHRRRLRLMADLTLDDRLRDLFLDRQLWGAEEIRVFLHLADTTRISALRNNVRIFGPGPHPAVLPSVDAPMGRGKVRYKPGIEAGRVREWAFQAHRVIFDPHTGELVLNPNWRQGRPRTPRPTMSWRRYEPSGDDGRRALRGVPRKKKTTEQGDS